MIIEPYRTHDDLEWWLMISFQCLIDPIYVLLLATLMVVDRFSSNHADLCGWSSQRLRRVRITNNAEAFGAPQPLILGLVCFEVVSLPSYQMLKPHPDKGIGRILNSHEQNQHEMLWIRHHTLWKMFCKWWFIISHFSFLVVSSFGQPRQLPEYEP